MSEAAPSVMAQSLSRGNLTAVKKGLFKTLSKNRVYKDAFFSFVSRKQCCPSGLFLEDLKIIKII